MMNSYLEKIIENKKIEVVKLEKERELLIEKSRSMNKPSTFHKKLTQKGLSLIAEIKKASPSKGIINPYFDPLKLSEKFLKSNASCLSVLTEESSFLGNPEYIKLIKDHYDVEILRKDFIVNELQIYQSKLLGASSILLIKAILSDDELKKFNQIAKLLDLDVLVEVHNLEELKSVININENNMIGINNRDLKSFKVDIKNAITLGRLAREMGFKESLIAESGYQSLNDLLKLEGEGFDAVLIGEGLIKNKELLKAF